MLLAPTYSQEPPADGIAAACAAARRRMAKPRLLRPVRTRPRPVFGAWAASDSAAGAPVACEPCPPDARASTATNAMSASAARNTPARRDVAEEPPLSGH